MQKVLPRSVIESSARNVYGHPERVTPELVDRYTAMTVRAGNRKALAQRDWGGDAAATATLRVPTLIPWGGRDRLIPPEHARQFARDIPGKDAQRTVDAVQRFLVRTSAR